MLRDEKRWRGVLGLRGHDREMSRSGERAEMIPIMAKGAEIYSGTGEDEAVVRSIYCKVGVFYFLFLNTSCR